MRPPVLIPAALIQANRHAFDVIHFSCSSCDTKDVTMTQLGGSQTPQGGLLLPRLLRPRLEKQQQLRTCLRPQACPWRWAG